MIVDMTDSFTVSTVLPASAMRLYEAWLNGEEHSAFTGAAAVVDASVGGAFSAWDGYISGTTIAMDPSHRILQAWRTTEFPPESPDSRLEITFKEVEGGTRITLIHSEIPDGQGQEYEQGWRDYYFKPMAIFFAAG